MESNESSGMELIEYWYILIRQWKVIAVIAIVAVALGIVYVSISPKVYEADCKLLIVDNKSSSGLMDNITGSDLMLGSLGKSDPIATQIEVIKTRPILMEVIIRCNLRYDNNVAIDPGAFANAIKLEAVRNTSVICITYRDYNPENAANVINTLAQVAVEQNQKLNQEESRAVRIFIENQLEIQKSKLEEAEQLTVQYKKSNKTVSMDLQTRSRIDAAAELEAEKMKLESQFQGVIAQKNQVEVNLSGPGAQADPFYASRLNMLEQIKNRLSNIQAQKKAVNTQIAIANNTLSSMPQEEVRIARLMRDEKTASDIYMNLLSQYEEFKIKEAAKVASVKIIEPAVMPYQPVLPKKRKTLMLALMLGLALGCGFAFLREYMDDTPGSIEEIKRALPYDMLGAVPVTQDKGCLFLHHSPTSLASESIRLVHTNLKFKGINEKKHLSLLITSALPEEGKTTIASNLALSFSTAGKKTALINLDLRRPVFHDVFNTKFVKGVTDYLIGEASIENIISRPQGLKIDVLEAGSIPPNPTELIASESMQKLIAYLENAYDVCVFDSAPVTMVAETLDVARSMDGIILVVDSSATSLKSIKAMQELFEGKKLPIMGFIINKFGAGKIGAHGYYGYGKYGKHGKYSYNSKTDEKIKKI